LQVQQYQRRVCDMLIRVLFILWTLNDWYVALLPVYLRSERISGCRSTGDWRK
jgi:hypothetical protein